MRSGALALKGEAPVGASQMLCTSLAAGAADAAQAKAPARAQTRSEGEEFKGLKQRMRGLHGKKAQFLQA